MLATALRQGKTGKAHQVWAGDEYSGYRAVCGQTLYPAGHHLVSAGAAKASEWVSLAEVPADGCCGSCFRRRL